MKMVISAHKSGTVAAFEIMVGENPIANMRSFDALLDYIFHVDNQIRARAEIVSVIGEQGFTRALYSKLVLPSAMNSSKLHMTNHVIGPQFLSLAEEYVAPEDLVFHKFYVNKMKSTKTSKKKKKKKEKRKRKSPFASLEEYEDLIERDDKDDSKSKRKATSEPKKKKKKKTKSSEYKQEVKLVACFARLLDN